jgi:hypothetical protein
MEIIALNAKQEKFDVFDYLIGIVLKALQQGDLLL